MKVKCIKRFEKICIETGIPNNWPCPQVGKIYTVCGDNGIGYFLMEFPYWIAYDKTKLAPITPADFQFEDINEVLRGAEERINEPTKIKEPI